MELKKKRKKKTTKKLQSYFRTDIYRKSPNVLFGSSLKPTNFLNYLNIKADCPMNIESLNCLGGMTKNMEQHLALPRITCNMEGCGHELLIGL